MQIAHKHYKTLGIIIVISTTLFASMSCKKFLAEKPDASLTVPKTLTELEGLFNDAERMNFNLTPSMGESSADDYFLLQETYDALPTQWQQVYSWSLKEYRFQNDWSANYIPVYNANFALESLSKIQRTASNERQWDKVKGYSLFFRAYSFLNLVWIFSKAYDSSTASTDLGIVLRLGADFNQPSQRSSVEQTYHQIIKDTKEAANYLPEMSSNVLLPSKAACYGLLSRTYLSTRQYDSAYKYSDLCIQLTDDILDYNTIPVTDDIPFPRLDNPETIFYSEMNTFNTNHYSFSGFVDSTLIRLYNANDLRLTAFFSSQNNLHRFKGAYTANSILLFTGLANDEIFLIRAECSARKNMISGAMNDLNTLMKKRWNNDLPYLDFIAIDREHAITQILAERRKELLMRGIRWSDIKRLNKEGREIIPKRLINGNEISLPSNNSRYALPIPADIISITGMPQN